MSCKVCCRQADQTGLCENHSKALNNIQDKFNYWETALGVSWKQYLVEIQKNSLTGLWAKDVVKYLIEEEDKK
jgi:hypothetical protein